MLVTLLAAVAIPFLVSLGAAGLMRARFRSATGSAIGMGFLAASVAEVGTIPFLVPGPNDALTIVAMAVTLAALVPAFLSLSPRAVAILFFLGSVAAAACSIGAADLYLAATLANLRVTLIGLGCLVAAARMAVLIRAAEADPGILTVASLGLGGVVAAGPGSLGWALPAALGMAGIGWRLMTRQGGQGSARAVAWFVLGTILLALAADLGRNALMPPWAMALLLPCLWADQLAGLARSKSRGRRKRAHPLTVWTAAAAPAVVAVGVAAALAARARHGAL
jgi:hypothetical protein